MRIRPAPAAARIDGATDDNRAAREDQLLADLLAHPEQAAEVARIVPPETFTTEQRREVFMTIATLAAQGDLVDEVVVLWEFQRLRAVADLYGGDLRYRGDETSPEPTAAYLTRLADMSTTDTAITIGYELVVDDVREQLARSAANAAQRTPQIHAHQAYPHRQFDPALQPPAETPNGHQPKIDR
jgi:replicative DNA helicase